MNVTIDDLYRLMLGMNDEFRKLNARIDMLEFRFDRLEKRVDKLEKGMNKKFDVVYQHFDGFVGMFTSHEEEIAVHSVQLSRLNKHLGLH